MTIVDKEVHKEKISYTAGGCVISYKHFPNSLGTISLSFKDVNLSPTHSTAT